jgi:hypothetical protein
MLPGLRLVILRHCKFSETLMGEKNAPFHIISLSTEIFENITLLNDLLYRYLHHTPVQGMNIFTEIGEQLVFITIKHFCITRQPIFKPYPQLHISCIACFAFY